ncbi:uncharacterized protein RJT21DRAFT_117614 [Scheffersomyces amazonensis]|uniref:uncharacterized protein n=1 Tax=Scheffersomyces amazonensis TaxID=1078765 RepID=UPI00315D9D20
MSSVTSGGMCRSIKWVMYDSSFILRYHRHHVVPHSTSTDLLFIRHYSDPSYNMIDEDGTPFDFESIDQKRIDDFRVSRTLKHFKRRVEDAREKKATAESFVKHRSNIVGIFNKTSDNVDLLFKDQNHKENYKHIPITSYKEIPGLVKVEKLEYNDASIKSSLMLLAISLINSVLVELNVRKLLLQEGPQVKTALINDMFINNIRQQQQQQNILKLLSNLYDKSQGTPTDFKLFFSRLDREATSNFINDIKTSDHFNSIRTYRNLFTFFKSSQYLTYYGSINQFNESKHNVIKFHSTRLNNDEYLSGFNSSFNQFNQDGDHLNLAIGIASTLLTCQNGIPNMVIFKFLLDTFHQVGLYNFESLVHNSMFEYKHQSLVLSKAFPSYQSMHFRHLIEDTPTILPSLIRYQVHRQNGPLLRQLLSFLNINEVISYEKLLDKTKLTSMISKSMYYKNYSERYIPSNTFTCLTPLYIMSQDIYDIMNSCISMHQYQHIDALFNKLILHTINDNTSRVCLNVSKVNENSLILNSNLPYPEIHAMIFNNTVFEILIRAARLSQDLGRMMWVLPHLDEYLSDPNRCQTIVNDTKLTKEIYSALKLFGLEGKLNTYESMFNFVM